MTVDRYVLTAGEVSLAVVPGLGSKIVSLRYADGPEWLAAPVRPLREIVGPPGSWSDHDCSGWDECFPNVGVDARRGLPDHGEVWSAPWRVEDATSHRVTTVVTVHDRYRLTRTVTVRDHAGAGTVVLDYRVDASGRTPLSWAWAQHPLLAADDSMRLVLPRPAPVRVDSAFSAGQEVTRPDWLPADGRLPGVTPMRRIRNRAAKLWFEPPVPGVVAVARADDWLAWRLDRSTTPHLGLWVNRAGWGDEALQHVAVEPAFGADDDFGRAHGRGAGPDLASGDRFEWRVTLQLGRGRPSAPGQWDVIPN